MRVLVTGGRDYSDYDQVCRELTYLMYPKYFATGERGETPVDLVIIHGGAKGADSLAQKWCEDNSVPSRVVFPDWDLHGKKAGILRNIQMLEEYHPDLVVAFPGGKGTAHMVKIAREANIPVKEVK